MSKRLTLCCALLCTAALAVRADDHTPITTAGSSYLLFTFVGLGNMAAGPLQAPANPLGVGSSNAGIPVYGAGYRYFIANDLAIRGTVGLALNSRTAKVKDNTDSTESWTGIQIGAGIEKHMAATSAFSGYMGGGVAFLSGSHKQTPSHASSGQDMPTTTSGSDLSLSVFGGVEWFFTQSISLNAEYDFGAVFSSGSQTTTTSNGTSTTQTTNDLPSGTFFGTQSVGVGLNVYIGR